MKAVENIYQAYYNPVPKISSTVILRKANRKLWSSEVYIQMCNNRRAIIKIMTDISIYSFEPRTLFCFGFFFFPPGKEMNQNAYSCVASSAS